MKLGGILKTARQGNGMSLRDVEREVGISNGYLSQLESNKVKQPSPVHLHALAELYDLEYSELMERAGYVAPEARRRVQGMPGLAFSGSEKLTPEEREMVQQLINYFRDQHSDTTE